MIIKRRELIFSLSDVISNKPGFGTSDLKTEWKRPHSKPAEIVPLTETLRSEISLASSFTVCWRIYFPGLSLSLPLLIFSDDRLTIELNVVSWMGDRHRSEISLLAFVAFSSLAAFPMTLFNFPSPYLQFAPRHRAAIVGLYIHSIFLTVLSWVWVGFNVPKLSPISVPDGFCS